MKNYWKKWKRSEKLFHLGVEARAKARIKVRHRLLRSKSKIKILKLKNKEEFGNLIKDELNVKEVIFDDKISGEVELDTKITPEA